MNYVLKLTSTFAALVLCANAAMAFTPAGEIMETSSSEITSTWQPSAAQRNDTIAEACVGFPYNQCVREFFLANRDKFPENVSTERDFWLSETVTYMVPTREGVITTVAAAETTAPAEVSVLDIINGVSTKQEELAEQFAVLSEDLSTMSVDDIDGLAARLSQFDEQVSETGPLRTAMAGFEEALLLLKNGQAAYNAQLATVQDRIDASLSTLSTDVADLKATNITFNTRISEVEETATQARDTSNVALTTANEAKANNARATLVTSNKGLLVTIGVPLILIAGLLIFTISNRRKVNGVAKSQTKTTGRVDAIETRLDEVEAESKATKKMAQTTRTDLEGHEADMDSMLEVKSTDIESVKENLTPTELANLQAKDGEVEQTYLCKGNTYVVTFSRDESTPAGYVENNLRRRVNDDELLGPISVKKLNGRLAAAISSGRLHPTATVQQFAAE